MVIRKLLPIWAWAVLACMFAGITIGVNVGYTTYVVYITVRNECDALKFILDHPNPHPTKGAQIFYSDVYNWAHRDGCI